MRLTSFIVNKQACIKMPLITLVLTIMLSNLTYAGALTYSPDQWPRHWNILINETQHYNGNHYNRNLYNNQAHMRPNQRRSKPARSTQWGVPPVAKPRSRRSVRPEYDTNSHLYGYNGPANFVAPYGTPYQGFNGSGLASPFAAPLLVPGMSPLLAPGLTAPGFPFVQPYSYYPYAAPYPYRGLVPGAGY